MAARDPYLFDREKRLLVLLDALGGEIGSTDLQKLLLLYCDEQDEPSYEFVPYRFGAFSFTSYAARRRLTRNGLLDGDTEAWKLTRAGRDLATRLTFRGRDHIYGFVRRTRDLRGSPLIAETYRRFPYTAIYSEIAKKVLRDDDAALQRIDASTPGRGEPGIVTIGYEGRSLECYLNLLIRDGATILCDVRNNPLSRRYGFARKTLANACAAVGIRYEHIPAFGIESAARKGLKTQEDYDDLFSVYEVENLPERDEEFAVLQRWIDKGERVALTCFERQPHRCHRRCISDAMECRTGERAVHL